ncbi:LysE family translocator [Microvirga arsenatis]|uniref:LysE family transporter n=1 Tax=Microvirga arsenatis TaxID=2692265 RepID=A0ABW9Z1G4_9HYPH|nr:LysE family translocator [Microvirga arsenatis]NBJ10602.1 LysE family transporter [Microvirga arsenatis]NBJ24499.1 LysE family transporter [Microvirga arsenatis]
MPSPESFVLFFAAALLIAITPGPGLFYVTARTLAGGRREGIASSCGTAIGGLVHVLAGAFGVSALVMASAEAFTLLKLFGAAYLVWLGFKTIREAKAEALTDVSASGPWRAFRDGVLVEALNPKTAAFFLAFIPQFVRLDQGGVALQFVMLGLVSIALNTLGAVLVTLMASRARDGLARRPHVIRRVRQASGTVMCGLGALLALARRPA